ncbi:MAG: type II secretion system F family protein [Candidatus Binatia bacterium]
MPTAIVNTGARMPRSATRRETLAAVERLHTLLDGGIPAADALAAAVACHGPGAGIMRSASRAVSRGLPLSRALGRARCRLDAADLALVRAGERSGELARALGLLRTRLEGQADARRGVTRALLYPAILLASTIAVVACMSAYVLPSFVSLYASSGVELPALTSAMIAVGPALGRLSAPAAGCMAMLVGVVVLLRKSSGRAALLIDSAWLAAPVAGRLLLLRERESLYGTVSVLIRAGLEIDRALELAAPAVGNVAVATAVRGLRRSLLRGVRLSDAVAASPLDRDGFDAAMLRTAEMTGDYAAAFARLAKTACDERRHRSAALIAVVEPLTTLVLAIVVGVTVLALYQPVLGSSALLLAGGP